MLRCGILVVLACALFLLPPVARAAGTPALHMYAARIHQLRVMLDSQARSPDGAALGRIRQELRAIHTVRLPDGAVLTLGTWRLADSLSGQDRSSLRAASAALDRLDDTLAALTPAAAPGGEQAALSTVYRDARFHPNPSVLERSLDWIGEQLNKLVRLFHWSSPNFSGPGPLLDGLVGGVFLLAVAVITYLLARSALRRTTVEETVVPEEGDPVSVREADLRAERFAREGDFRTALRFLFLRVMLELQRRGALTLSAGLTNREYLRLLREGAPETGPLRQLIDEFDRVWYGHGDLDETGYARCRELAARAAESAGSRHVA